jgi:hypothetical protein
MVAEEAAVGDRPAYFAGFYIVNGIKQPSGIDIHEMTGVATEPDAHERTTLPQTFRSRVAHGQEKESQQRGNEERPTHGRPAFPKRCGLDRTP